MQTQIGAPALAVHPDLLPMIQWHTIEFAKLGDGRFYVGMIATLCDENQEVSTLEILSERVGSGAEAQALIEQVARAFLGTLH
jgi:hypothetical protein